MIQMFLTCFLTYPLKISIFKLVTYPNTSLALHTSKTSTPTQHFSEQPIITKTS